VEKVTIDTVEVKRLIELTANPLRFLPFENDYKKGQLDMADTIIKLVEVAETKIGDDIASALDKPREAIGKTLEFNDLFKVRDALVILKGYYEWPLRYLEEIHAEIQRRVNGGPSVDEDAR
jgi:hypothetical protein